MNKEKTQQNKGAYRDVYKILTGLGDCDMNLFRVCNFAKV